MEEGWREGQRPTTCAVSTGVTGHTVYQSPLSLPIRSFPVLQERGRAVPGPCPGHPDPHCTVCPHPRVQGGLKGSRAQRYHAPARGVIPRPQALWRGPAPAPGRPAAAPGAAPGEMPVGPLVVPAGPEPTRPPTPPNCQRKCTCGGQADVEGDGDPVEVDSYAYLRRMSTLPPFPPPSPGGSGGGTVFFSFATGAYGNVTAERFVPISVALRPWAVRPVVHPSARGGAGMHWKGGGGGGLQGAQPMSKHCVCLTPSAGFNGICNRQ